MRPTMLEIDDLCPDGVRVVVDWEKFKIGTSFFVHCVDTEQARKEVKDIAERKGWKITSRLRIEDEHFGVRFWREL